MTKLFTAILNMSITAGYVALAVIAIRILFKKAPKVFSYALWLAVLIRLICPFSFNSAFSFLIFLNPKVQTNTGVMEYLPNNLGSIQNPAVDVGISRLNQFVNSSLPSATPTASVNSIQIIIEIAGIIWSVGMAALLIYSIISYIKAINNVKTATLIRDNIFETDRITSPFLCGFIKPQIYVPAGMSPNELSYILAHEQTHIKRLDYLIKPFAFLVLIVHWFNPLMWVSFALMSKDMEMSCDESVINKMGSDVKGSYSNSLLSLSIKRSGLILGSPLAFGESNIQSRIKNILNYKKPGFCVVVLAIIATALLIMAFTANPKNKQAPAAYSGYAIKTLMDNKTPYVGNNSKVIALIDAMPWPADLKRDTVALQTDASPYGITIHFHINDASAIKVSDDAFYRNSIMLFSLIDNVDVISCKISERTGNYDGASYGFTYTREMVEKLMGEDVRRYAVSTATLKSLIDQINKVAFGANTAAKSAKNSQIEKYLEIIMSSPKTSSNPYDYIKTHRNEYESILKMGDEALNYLLAQFENGGNNGLRGYIMMALCKDLLGNRNNATDESLSPRDWFHALSIRQETKLPDFIYDGNDPIEKLVYDTEVAQSDNSYREGFTIVAPKIFGSYKEDNKLKVFVTTYSTRYRLYDKILSNDGGSVVPAAIVYTKNADGSYTLDEYKQAMDGSMFAKSIKAYCTMPVSGKKIDGLADKILNHYGNYDDIRALERRNLIKHLIANYQKDVTLKGLNNKLVPLT